MFRLGLFLLCVLQITSRAAVVCEPQFPAVMSLPAEKNPASLVLADFDRNGKSDIVVANQGSGTISVFLHNGARTFQPAAVYDVGGEPNDLVAADFNADGIPDLAISSFGLFSSFSVMLGKGDGSFNLPERYSAEPYSRAIAAGDLNGDQKPDIVIAGESGATLTISLNNGDGTFADGLSNSGGTRPFDVILADFNGDSKLDVATADFAANGILIRLGNGDGTFGAGITYPTFEGPLYLAAGHLNEDRFTDLAVGNAGSADVVVLFGIGNGTFQEKKGYPAGVSFAKVALADFNKDGLTDMVNASNARESVSILLANASGGFRTPVHYTAGGEPVAIAARDLDGDGVPDVVVSNSIYFDFPGTITVAWGNGDGTLDAPLSYWVESSVRNLAGADFNADGNLDLATISHYGSYHVIFGDGAGKFASPKAGVVGYSSVSGLAVGNFDGSSTPGLATTFYRPPPLPGMPGEYSVGIYALQSDGTFLGINSFTTPLPPSNMRAVNLDRDARSEIALLSGPFRTLEFWGRDNNGRFLRSSPSVSVGANAYLSAPGDFDGNGKDELAVADEEGILLVNYGSAETTRVALSGVGLAGTGDFNRDGKDDLVLLKGIAKISLLSSNGDGTFSPTADYTVGGGGGYSATADMNLDGTNDLVLKHAVGVSILLGNGDGTLQPAAEYPVGYSPDSMVVHDFNGDQRPDIAVMSRGAVSVLLNKCATVRASLAVTRTAGKFVLSWPNSTGTVLESTSSLQDPSWQTNDETPSVNNGVATLELDANTPSRYFRLKH